MSLLCCEGTPIEVAQKLCISTWLSLTSAMKLINLIALIVLPIIALFDFGDDEHTKACTNPSRHCSTRRLSAACIAAPARCALVVFKPVVGPGLPGKRLVPTPTHSRRTIHQDLPASATSPPPPEPGPVPQLHPFPCPEPLRRRVHALIAFTGLFGSLGLVVACEALEAIMKMVATMLWIASVMRDISDAVLALTQPASVTRALMPDRAAAGRPLRIARKLLCSLPWDELLMQQLEEVPFPRSETALFVKADIDGKHYEAVLVGLTKYFDNPDDQPPVELKRIWPWILLDLEVTDAPEETLDESEPPLNAGSRIVEIGESLAAKAADEPPAPFEEVLPSPIVHGFAGHFVYMFEEDLYDDLDFDPTATEIKVDDLVGDDPLFDDLVGNDDNVFADFGDPHGGMLDDAEILRIASEFDDDDPRKWTSFGRARFFESRAPGTRAPSGSAVHDDDSGTHTNFFEFGQDSDCPEADAAVASNKHSRLVLIGPHTLERNDMKGAAAHFNET
ncbi:hypothetical protein HK105_207362 [Polyrhizophydium stewartii]|uniref:Uncharacterized protein n=1 Tax=Polyrhizophydium stewartii TaxID=2732419 RepID=A0ABR4N0S2_9FUNG